MSKTESKSSNTFVMPVMIIGANSREEGIASMKAMPLKLTKK